jgi:hypothetical protein
MISSVRKRIEEHVISKKDNKDPLKILSRMLYNRIPTVYSLVVLFAHRMVRLRAMRFLL